MKDIKLKMDDYLPLRDVVFNTLREAILVGDLEPGERLMEVELAKRLGVSRTPVREALHMLELEGLVEMIPRRGAHVASISKKDLQDVLEVRASLEIMATQLACDRITSGQLSDLKMSLLHFESAMASKDPSMLAKEDVAFHDVIIQSANNARLRQILNNLQIQFYRYRLEYLKDFSSHDLLVHEHRQLYDAIAHHDKETAKKLIAEHIYNQENAIMKSIEEREKAEHKK